MDLLDFFAHWIFLQFIKKIIQFFFQSLRSSRSPLKFHVCSTWLTDEDWTLWKMLFSFMKIFRCWEKNSQRKAGKFSRKISTKWSIWELLLTISTHHRAKQLFPHWLRLQIFSIKEFYDSKWIKRKELSFRAQSWSPSLQSSKWNNQRRKRLPSMSKYKHVEYAEYFLRWKHQMLPHIRTM